MAKRSAGGAKGQRRQESALKAGFVLAVDVVEYSLRPTPDQAEIIEKLAALARRCPAYSAAKKNGEVVAGPSGDGFVLAFFDGPLSPVRCAHELKRLVIRSGRFSVRQAIHIGAIDDVSSDISESANVAGEGVNLAVRALDSCGPNEIVLTQRAVEFVREAPEFASRLVPIGSATVKHGEEVNVYRLADPGEKRLDPLEPFLKRAESLHERTLRKGTGRPASPRVIAHRLRELQSETLLGLALIPFGLGLHAALEHTDFGRKARLSAYEQLSGLWRRSNENLPVTFVDIGNRFDRLGTEETDLRKLRDLLDAIAEHRPAAIAVDIDFGWHQSLSALNGSQGRYLDEQGIVTSRARQLSAMGCPVFLAVYEGLAYQNPEEWLGPGLEGLVVHPLRPDDALYGQVVMLGDMLVGKNRVPSLAGRLAQNYLGNDGAASGPPSWLVNEYSDFGRELRPLQGSQSADSVPKGAQLDGPLFLLNTSALNTLKTGHIDAQPTGEMLPGTEVDSKLRGKAVVVGASGVPNDFFTVPLSGEREWGPYFHALAAYTRIAAPLFEFSPVARIGLVVLSGLLILGATQIVRRKRIAEARLVSGENLTALFTAGVIATIAYSAVIFASSIGIVWTDFLFVAILLAFHPWMHNRARGFWEGRKAGVVA